MTNTGGAVSPPDDTYGSLTQRELTVLHEMGDGLTAAQIADRLAISPKTVESHKQRIYSKLGARNQSEAVAIALGRGLADRTKAVSLIVSSRTAGVDVRPRGARRRAPPHHRPRVLIGDADLFTRRRFARVCKRKSGCASSTATI